MHPLVASALVLVSVVALPARAGVPVWIPKAPPVPAAAAPAPVTVVVPPPAEPGRARVLVLDMRANDVDASLARTVTNIVVAGLSTYKTLDIVTSEDLKQMVELEATRSSMGCSEDASCLAEIAGALGAQLVVFGAVGKLGEATVVTLNMFDSQKAQALGRVSTQSKRVDRLPRRVAIKLHEMVTPYHESHNLVLPPPPQPEDTGPGAAPWVTVGSGALLAVGGAAAAVVGALPLLDYQAARGRIIAAEGRFPGDARALDEAKAAQTDLGDARAAYNDYGFLALGGGIALVVAGLVTAGAGAAWAVAAAQDADPDLGGAQ